MLVVGLTGNIAAGKSAVAARFAAHGVPIIDADRLARDAVAVGTPALAAIAATWGPTVLDRDGALDRAALRRIVFADPEQRRRLDAIVHPEVARRRELAMIELRAQHTPLVVADIPLLFEAALTDTVDRIVLVDAPESIRRERLVRDRGLSPADADAMIAAQLPSGPKRLQAHHVLDNTGTRAALDAQVDALLDTLLADAERRARAST